MDPTHVLKPRSPKKITPKTEKVNRLAALYKLKSSKPRMSQEEGRKSKRSENLNRQRDISSERVKEDRRPFPSSASTTGGKKRNKLGKEDGQKELLERLAEYRARKKEEREMALKNKKPIFKVCAVHHRPYTFDSKASSLPRTFNFYREQNSKCSFKKGLGTHSEFKLKVEMKSQPRKILFEKENIPKEEEEEKFENIVTEAKDLSEFRKLFDNTKNKLTELTNAWEEITPPDEEIEGSILAAIGCAKLLLDRKGRLQQFSNLIDNCEFSTGKNEITTEDLRGFWETVSCQADDVFKRFNDLKSLKDDDWKKFENVVVVSPKKRSNLKRQYMKEAKASEGIRAMLSIGRQQMKQSKTAASPKELILIEGEESKEFDGKFFKIISPIRPFSSTSKTPASSVEKRPINSSTLLRYSLIMNSVTKATSVARSMCKNAPLILQHKDFERVKDLLKGESVPLKYSDKDISLLPRMDTEESPIFPTNADFCHKMTLRRSKRLSERIAVDCVGDNHLSDVDSSKGDKTVLRRSKILSRSTSPVNYKL